MSEHKICKDCKFNHYPECHGIKMDDGNYMNIENLKPGFRCGQKNEDKLFDFSIKKKSELELKIEALEERINELEGVKS